MSKITINCSPDVLILIERALELYTRIGLCQFENMTLVSSLQKEIWKDDTNKMSDDFRAKCNELKAVFGLSGNSSYGIFNTTNVSDDVRIAAHLQHQIRHARYLNRVNSGEQTERHYTVDEHPADICQIANMSIPDLKIEIYEQVN